MSGAWLRSLLRLLHELRWRGRIALQCLRGAAQSRFFLGLDGALRPVAAVAHAGTRGWPEKIMVTLADGGTFDVDAGSALAAFGVQIPEQRVLFLIYANEGADGAVRLRELPILAWAWMGGNPVPVTTWGPVIRGEAALRIDAEGPVFTAEGERYPSSEAFRRALERRRRAEPA